jgi:hypothetical protein
MMKHCTAEPVGQRATEAADLHLVVMYDIKELGTILSIWAHPDDEVYLCGAIMAMGSCGGLSRGVRYGDPRRARRNRSAALASGAASDHPRSRVG